MSMEELLNGLGDRVVMLLVILPLLAAAVVPLAARAEPRYARTVALLVSSVSVLLAGGMVWRYDPQTLDDSGAPVTTQMVSGFVWDIGVSGAAGDTHRNRSTPDPKDAASKAKQDSGFRIEFGVDGLGLWPAACVPVIMWCLLVAEWDRWSGRSPAVLSFLLLLEAGLISFFSAQDVLTASLGLLSVASLLPLLLGASGGERRRLAARRLMLQQWTAALLVTAGLAGLLGVHAVMIGVPDSPPGAPTWQIDQFIAAVPGLNSPAGAVWSRIASCLFLTLIIGFFFWSGLAPSHSAAVVAHLEGDAPSQVALTALSLNAGVYGLLRFVTPLFPQLSMSFSPALFFLAACGVLYTAAWMTAVKNAVRLAAGVGILWRSLALAGLASMTVNGIRGCVLLIPAAMLAAAAWIMAQGGMQRFGRKSSRHADPLADGGVGRVATAREREAGVHEPATDHLRPSGTTVLSAFAAAGLPGTALFPGALLVIGGLVEMRWEPPGGWMLTSLLVSGSLRAAAGSVLRTLAVKDDHAAMIGRSHGRPKSGPLAALIVLAGLLISLGVRPGLVLDPAQPTLVTLLGLPEESPE